MVVARLVSLLVLSLGACRGQDVASECPAPNGFFADARQCDMYYQCVDNVLSEKLCPDGMAFNDINPAVEKCDLLAQVDCSDRPKLQVANPTEHCKRQNGNFAPDVPNCQQAYRCVDGVSTLITCPEGLAFALETGICDWPDQTGRSDCNVEKNETFKCPKVKLDVAVSHPRYADPTDCQYFYVCINGETPRRNGCSFGQVFNTNTSTCTTPQEVPECADYYTEYFDDYFASVDANPARLDTSIVAAAVAAGYEVPKFRDRVRIQPGVRSGNKNAAAAAPAPAPARSPASPPARRTSTRGGRPGERPQRRRPDGKRQGGLRRRKRPRPTTTTTTTTTTPPPPEYEYYYDDDYYYYEDEPADNNVPQNGEGDAAAAGTAGAPVVAPAPSSSRSSLPVRPLPLARTGR